MSRRYPDRPAFGAPADGYISARGAAKRIGVDVEVIEGLIANHRVPDVLRTNLSTTPGTTRWKYWVPETWVQSVIGRMGA